MNNDVSTRELHRRHAEQELMTRGSVAARFLFYSEDIGAFILATPWKSQEEQGKYLYYAHLLCAAHNCTNVTHMCEVYLKTPSGDTAKEAVLVVELWRDDEGRRNSRQITFAIIRNNSGAPLRLQLFNDTLEMPDGPLLNVMTLNPPTFTERSYAADRLKDHKPTIH